jgi:hypothetical protein
VTVKPNAIERPVINGVVRAGNPFSEAPKVYGLRHYGNPVHIRFAMKFQDQDRKKKNPQADLYGRTVSAIVAKFNCSESLAKKSIMGWYAYRMACFANEVPTIAGKLVEDLERIAAKAEAAKDFSASVSALKEVAKIAGIYAPLKVEVEHHAGPSAESQLRAMLAVMDERDKADMERILGNLERAKTEGRLQLPSGDDDEPPPMAEPDEIEDAEVIEEQVVKVGER